MTVRDTTLWVLRSCSNLNNRIDYIRHSSTFDSVPSLATFPFAFPFVVFRSHTSMLQTRQSGKSSNESYNECSDYNNHLDVDSDKSLTTRSSLDSLIGVMNSFHVKQVWTTYIKWDGSSSEEPFNPYEVLPNFEESVLFFEEEDLELVNLDATRETYSVCTRIYREKTTKK